MKKLVFTILLAVFFYQSFAQSKYDVNNDGKVTMADANEVVNYYLMHTGDTVSDNQSYIDLGLPSGTLWATCNLGATSPEKYGNYYAWGEVTPKEYFAEENCTTYGKSQGDSISGTQYDAATATLGKNWRIPNKQQFSELTAKCTWVHTTVNGFPVMKGTGPNGNTIILTLNGWINGYNYKELNNDIVYWVSEEKNDNLGCMIWGIGGTKFYSDQCNPKYIGQAIRPIYVKSDTVQTSSNLLPGKFSVSSTKQVQFTKGNLFWNGTKFDLEDNQIVHISQWTSTHVAYFYWSSKALYTYSSNNNDPNKCTSDIFFADGSGDEHCIAIDESKLLYVLSDAEWEYIFKNRTNAKQLYKTGVTVDSIENCVIIAPDNFVGTLQSQYSNKTLDEDSLVCLAPCGENISGYVEDSQTNGFYLSSTGASADALYAYGIAFGNSYLNPTYYYSKLTGLSVRLVQTVK